MVITADISSLLLWNIKSLRETSADAILIASVPVDTYNSKLINSVSINLNKNKIHNEEFVDRDFESNLEIVIGPQSLTNPRVDCIMVVKINSDETQ